MTAPPAAVTEGHCPHLDAGDPPHLVEFFGCEDSAIEGAPGRARGGRAAQAPLRTVFA